MLDLRDQEFILTVNDNVPPGVYSKIRLEILKVQPEGDDSICADRYVKLPSNKIDLNPRENFEVVPGGTLVIHLDVDVDKSMLLNVAGKSGKCIFRPVIFVDIDTEIGIPERCPRVLTGAFAGYILDDDEDDVTINNIIGFNLDLGNGRETIKVLFKDETIIFDKDGIKTGIESLPGADELHVRGRLNSEGCFVASEIVIGGVEEFKGVVKSTHDDTLILVLSNDLREIEVTLSPDTVILNGCDTVFEGEILPGMFARVYGKFDSSEETTNIFRALLIMLRPQPVSSLLTNIEDADQGYNLTISNGGESFPVFLPGNAVVKLEGDGFVDIDRLKDWVDCAERAVKVVYDTNISDPLTAEKLIVVPDVFTGNINDMDFFIEKNATIFEIENGQQRLIEMDEVEKDAEVVAYGIEACESEVEEDIDFYVFVLLIFK